MKTKPTFPIIGIILLMTISCNDDAPSNKVFIDAEYCSNTSIDCTDNYPLIIGYIKKNSTESYEITGNKTVDTKSYFVWSVKSQTNVTEYYERIEDNRLYARYVITGGAISDEFQVMDFSGDINTEWNVDNFYDLGSAILKIEAKNANLTIKNVTFSNAIKVSISFPSSPGLNYHEYYLPGLGFVKGGTDLFEFHIGGKIYLIK